MIIPIFQVDAFTERLFGGNPAAVCPLDFWLPDSLMQQIAAENNLAETAFVVEENEGLRIRWFTPSTEVDLCGHATLATGHVLYNHLGFSGNEIMFNSRSGKLLVKRNGNVLTLDFPADEIKPVGPGSSADPLNHSNEDLAKISTIFGSSAKEVWKGKSDYMIVLASQKEVEAFIPDMRLISTINARGIIITAKGDSCDFVSRFFAPQSGVDEDPVTGSAHTTLGVYWSSLLSKNDLSAMQLSKRKGVLQCVLKDNRVEISGKCTTYMVGEVFLPDNLSERTIF